VFPEEALAYENHDEGDKAKVTDDEQKEEDDLLQRVENRDAGVSASSRQVYLLDRHHACYTMCQ